ncbi:MAG TPA: hypothetical protein VIV63_04930 [Steroidobacteraceae bacterium]
MNVGLDTSVFESPDFADALRVQYRRASNGAIELDPVFESIAPILAAGQPARDGDLHFAMRQLSQNPSRQPIDTIGLLVASSHVDDNRMFGLMFDQGLAAVPGDINAAVPREGAAVFVDTIAGRRTPEDVANEVLFTAIHELGHAFNLSHAPQEPPTFMSRSAVNDRAYDGSAFFFNQRQQAWLSSADSDFRVRPGESVFLDRDSRNSAEIPSASGDDDLKLAASLHPAECTRFEPIHLDISLSIKGRADRRVPRMLDPSHSAFRIFIEDPAGRSRLYKNSVHCCATPRRLRVSRSAPFRRDIVLTIEGGHYTFREPGVYRVRVEFDCSPDCTLRSNVAEINILAKPDKSFATTAKMLAMPSATRLLQYRCLPNAKVVNAMSGLIDSWKGRWDERQSLIAYRWALSVLREGVKPVSPALILQARRYLERCRSLLPHREERVEELLASVARHSRLSPSRLATATRREAGAVSARMPR